MTLEMAVLHKDALEQAFARAAHEPRHRFYHGGYVDLHRGDTLQKDTWSRLQMVSVERPVVSYSLIAGEAVTAALREKLYEQWRAQPATVLGYLSAAFDREDRVVSNLGFIRFSGASFVFARDMAKFLRLLFDGYGMHTVCWTVTCGSPHERSYEKLCALLGGRMWGVQREAVVLMDGTRHDRKHFEVLAANLNRRALDRLCGGRSYAEG